MTPEQEKKLDALLGATERVEDRQIEHARILFGDPPTFEGGLLNRMRVAEANHGQLRTDFNSHKESRQWALRTAVGAAIVATAAATAQWLRAALTGQQPPHP